MAQVAIVMGSDSDWPIMRKACDLLEQFGVSFEVRVISAHRSPQAAHDFAAAARSRGVQVIIAAAGMSAALAGVIASLTTLPVIGVPIGGGLLDGMDALLSTVQMPPGVPVAAVAVGGAANAALLAVQMLSLAEPPLAEKLAAHKAKLAREVEARNAKLQNDLKADGTETLRP